MSAFETQRQAIARAALADAPSGDPCPACHEIHESATAEADCITDHEAHYNPNPLGVASTQQLIAGATHFNRMVELYHDGVIDATDIPGMWR